MHAEDLDRLEMLRSHYDFGTNGVMVCRRWADGRADLTEFGRVDL